MYVSYTCVFMCVYVYLQLYPLMLHQRGGGGTHKASVLLMSSDKAAELRAPRLLDLAVAGRRRGWVGGPFDDHVAYFVKDY